MAEERFALLAALAAFPDRLGAAARRAAAPRAAAGPPPPAGEWGPEEVVRHLIAVELDVHQARLHDLETLSAPVWSWAEPGPWPDQPELSLDALLARFAESRATTIRTLEALDDAGWARTGTHTRLGVWDVAGLVRNTINHDEEHLHGLG